MGVKVSISVVLTACLLAVACSSGSSRDSRPEQGTVKSSQRPASIDTQAGVDPAPTEAVPHEPVPAREGYHNTELAFPSNDRRTATILLTKEMPIQVPVGHEFTYYLHVSNLTDVALPGVVVSDTISKSLPIVTSEPNWTQGKGGVYEWELGALAPRETRAIAVRGVAPKEGSWNTCAKVSYGLCAPIEVVKPKLQLTKTAPARALSCDEVAWQYRVCNPGSGIARDVRIQDTLPAGLVTIKGNSSVNFSAGDLKGGQCKTFKLLVRATQPGTFASAASARGGGSLEAESEEVGTTICEPVLALTKTGPENGVTGQPVEYTLTVKNTGDGTATDLVMEDIINAGAKFLSASDGGVAGERRVSWNLADLAPGESRAVTVTYVAQEAARFAARSEARARCAKPIGASAVTMVKGIPAVVLEVVELNDPIAVGEKAMYVIRVTNSGNAPDTTIRITCELEENLAFLSAEGPTRAKLRGNRLSLSPLSTLAPGQKAEWKLTLQAVKAGDVRFKVSMTSAQLTRPVEETEATLVY